MTDGTPARAAGLVDAAWRGVLVVAYRLALIWWFVRRPQQQGAYVAAWLGEELLLIRNSYKPGETVPCGGLARDESPLQAARRELAEEVGIEVETDRLAFVELIALENEYKHDHAHFFELQLEARPQIRIDRREVVWAEFVHRDELDRRPLVDPVREYLRRRSPR